MTKKQQKEILQILESAKEIYTSREHLISKFGLCAAINKITNFRDCDLSNHIMEQIRIICGKSLFYKDTQTLIYDDNTNDEIEEHYSARLELVGILIETFKNKKTTY